MSNVGSRFALTLALVVGVGLTSATLAVSAPRLVEEGPGPIFDNFFVDIPPNFPVSGAINAIAASQTNPDLVYAGAVNGGVWKTTNATADPPSWSPLTDRRLPGLSINSLAISPVNPRILFAGTGSTSSFGFDGSPGFGVARSTDGGRSWSVLAQDTFSGRRINSVVPTTLDGGNVVLAATLLDQRPGSDVFVIPAGGVFRSTDMGDSFVRLSGDGSSGLPDQGVSSLVGDAGNRYRFYAAVPAGLFGAAGGEGIYRSDDGGVTWAAVNSGLPDLGSSLRILLAVHNNLSQRTNAVYAAVLTLAVPNLLGVFRSDNLGATWTTLGAPSDPLFPSGQELFQGSVAADPMDPNVVFIAGDFGGNWRGDASLLPGSPWTRVDFDAAHGTAPHPDSRAMVFDANGNLLQSSDGGLYRLVDPDNRLNQRQWVSVNGNIRPTEFHSVAYDPLSGIVFGGAQDTGVPIQPAPGEFTWVTLLSGDGGNVGVDNDQFAHPGTTIRYTGGPDFGFFNRTTWDATNTMLGGLTPAGLLITSGPGTGESLFTFDNVQFSQPFVLNAIDPSRMLIGTSNIYESLDRGDTLANLGNTGNLIGNGLGASPMAYGGHLAGMPYSDVFYVGANSAIFHRVALGGPITTLGNYPGSSQILSLVIDPQNYRHVFVSDSDSRVWGSFDEGVSWLELTANLPTLSTSIRVLEFVRPSAQGKPVVLLAGGLGGVFQLRHPRTPGAQWKPLTRQLPHGLVLDLHYDANDDVLVAGFLGRGAWTLSGFFGSNVAYVEAPQAEDEMDVAEDPPREPTGAAERLLRQLPPVPVTLPPPVAIMPKELTAH